MTRKTFGKKNPNLPFYPAVRAAEAGADLEDVVKTTVYLEDARDFEIDAIAYKPE